MDEIDILIEELNDIDVRIVNLVNSLSGYPINWDSNELSRVQSQLDIMKAYSRILGERIRWRRQKAQQLEQIRIDNLVTQRQIEEQQIKEQENTNG